MKRRSNLTDARDGLRSLEVGDEDSARLLKGKIRHDYARGRSSPGFIPQGSRGPPRCTPIMLTTGG